MSNHYHLLLQTPEPNLVRGMSWLQGTYTSRFYARHKFRGHVFSGRYKVILVQVGIEDGLDSFPWSILAYYRCPPSKREKRQASELGFEVSELQDNTAGRRKFLQNLEWRAAQEEVEKAGLTEIEGQGLQATLRRGWYFGNQQFHETLLDMAKAVIKQKAKKHNYCGEELKEHGEQRAEKIVKKGLRLCGLKEAELEMIAKGDSRKALIALAVKQETAVFLKWIAGRLKMGVTTGVSRYASEAKAGIGKSREQKNIFRKMVG